VSLLHRRADRSTAVRCKDPDSESEDPLRCPRFALLRLPETAAPRCDPIARTARSVNPLVAQTTRVASHLAFLGCGPSGCPNDLPPGARARRTPLPKCFASSATELARKLPPAWSPFPVTDGFVVCCRGLHKGFLELFFDAQECPQSTPGCPPPVSRTTGSSTGMCTKSVDR
jgi:hypothetical protein